MGKVRADRDMYNRRVKISAAENRIILTQRRFLFYILGASIIGGVVGYILGLLSKV